MKTYQDKNREEGYEPLYWSSKGKFQKEYDELYGKLVPLMGDAPTKDGQLIRFIGSVYYDIYNNGGINLYLLDEARQCFKKNRIALSNQADEMEIENFLDKLRRFGKGKTSDRECDEVVDVIVSYVYKNQTAEV